MFEYTVTYYHVEYFMERRDSFLEEYLPVVDPNPESLSENPIFLNYINEMGAANWELISVSPLLRGCFSEAGGFGYSVTAGYYFFWKRPRVK